MCENPGNLGRQEPRGCRFIYGDPGEEWHYCQRNIVIGGKLGDAQHPPYCTRHTKVCVQSSTPAQLRAWETFADRLLEGDPRWLMRLDKAAETALKATETANLVPVDVRVTLTNRKGLLHD